MHLLYDFYLKKFQRFYYFIKHIITTGYKILHHNYIYTDTNFPFTENCFNPYPTFLLRKL